MGKTKDLLNNLPHFYAKHGTSNNYKLLNAVGGELDALEAESTNLVSSIQIDTAKGSYLDDIGNLFRLTRLSDETDSEFRARIKGFWQSRIGGGTLESLRNAISSALSINTSDITLTEVDYMKVGVNIDITEPSKWDLFDLAIDTAEEAKAAGIYIGVKFTADFVRPGVFTIGVSSIGSRDVL